MSYRIRHTNIAVLEYMLELVAGCMSQQLIPKSIFLSSNYFLPLNHSSISHLMCFSSSFLPLFSYIKGQKKIFYLLISL